MANDPFLSQLGADWRRQTADLAGLRELTERRGRRTRLVLVARAVGTGVAALSGGWFVWLALNDAPALFALAGIAMLVSLPLMILEVAGTARSLRIAHDDTPAGVLRRARDQAAAARDLLWATRAAAIVLAASAAGLVGLSITGRARVGDTLLIAPFWVLLALGLWAWQATRARRLASEVARCDVMLAELADDHR